MTCSVVGKYRGRPNVIHRLYFDSRIFCCCCWKKLFTSYCELHKNNLEIDKRNKMFGAERSEGICRGIKLEFDIEILRL